MSTAQITPIFTGVTSDLVTTDGARTFPDDPLRELRELGLTILRIDFTRDLSAEKFADIGSIISVPHGPPIDAMTIYQTPRLTDALSSDRIANAGLDVSEPDRMAVDPQLEQSDRLRPCTEWDIEALLGVASFQSRDQR